MKLDPTSLRLFVKVALDLQMRDYAIGPARVMTPWLCFRVWRRQVHQSPIYSLSLWRYHFKHH